MPPELDPAQESPIKDTRVPMANYRTRLALDRTTLSWTRTALTMASFGFGMVSFFRAARMAHPGGEAIRLHEGAIRFGTWLVVLGIAATIASAVSHLLALRKLARNEPPSSGLWSLSITLALMLAVAGLSCVWSLLAHH